MHSYINESRFKIKVIITNFRCNFSTGDIFIGSVVPKLKKKFKNRFLIDGRPTF